MSNRSKGARLWLKPGRPERNEAAVWIIRDGPRQKSTGFGAGQMREAQRALADYIIATQSAPRIRDRDPNQVLIGEVISIYIDDVAHKHRRPHETAARLARVSRYFGELTLADLNKRVCGAYVTERGHATAARRELEDLRAAVVYHWKELGLCSVLTPVALPDRPPPRQRWLTRSEAARLLRAAWRLREQQGFQPTQRRTGMHLARFILVGLYTGTRAGAICGAALEPTVGRGFIDLDRGVFYRKAQGAVETNKRQPPVRLGDRLLAHLRRWRRLGLIHRAVIEWDGREVKRINKGFRTVRAAAGLGPDVTPHTLRHTCATWLAQRGLPIWEAAGYLGMSTEMFQKVYGHHHPDHQEQAANALTRTKPSRAAASNVVRLAAGAKR
jgi:integrase